VLKQRVFTAIVLAIVLVGSIFFGTDLWNVFFFSVVLFVATRELLALTLRLDNLINIFLSIVFSSLFVWSVWAITAVQLWQAVSGFVIWIIISIWLPFYRYSGEWSLPQRVFLLAVGLILLWICVHGLIHIHGYFEDGGLMLLYLFTLVWVADIGAYFSGRRFGKHKLAPGISPGKTWEGVAGGVAANLVWMMVVYQFTSGWGIPLTMFIIIGLITSVISVVGDLFESILKREAGVKDSGKLLPGHGGVLDRVDSIIAATPVFVTSLYLVGLA
jgi:phosphatidate cytidylyltransferase